MSMPPAKMQVREATLADWEEIKRICKDIWDGEDYVPDAFPRWIEDNNCHVFVLEDEECHCLRGVVNIRVIDQGETAWFEGIRIDPTYQGRGLGSILTEFIVQWSRTHLPTVQRYRLMIEEHNTPSLRLAQKYGFQIVATAVYFRLNVNAKLANAFSAPRGRELTLRTDVPNTDEIMEFYLTTWKERVAINAILMGWNFATITAETVQQLMEHWNLVPVATNDQKIVGCCGWKVDNDQNGTEFIRVLVHARDDDLPSILTAMSSHLTEQHPSLTDLRWHVQAKGHVIESIIGEQDNKEFYRFFLLERTP